MKTYDVLIQFKDAPDFNIKVQAESARKAIDMAIKHAKANGWTEKCKLQIARAEK